MQWHGVGSGAWLAYAPLFTPKWARLEKAAPAAFSIIFNMAQAESRMDEARVREKTGKGWDEWFSIIDSMGGMPLGHTKIAKALRDQHGVDPWYSQMLTVQYERERGGRKINQRAKGFDISFQRKIKAPVDRVYRAWTEPDELNRWFTTKAKVEAKVGGRYSNADGDAGEFRRVEPNKRLVFTWEQKQHQPGSVVDVMFMPEGPEKTVVYLTHRKLQSKEDADDLKNGGWRWALDSLKSYLESGRPVKYEDWKAQLAK